ncbi:hypothetical protein [Nonomuraea basaltis]|uniref:hypothetical protein n=1 Tax=Nonomuraea basaltis TaxID=2495887 RepID=UPI00110C5B57|nr:hypothetical protein [Nonomuraea basaltis]TMR94972.1 hypothetical protein EJK15_31125 [Nonomuraea basaltis]
MPPRITTALAVAASVVAGTLAPAGYASAAAATDASAAAKPNLRACYDGRCKLTLTKRVSFRVSSRFGITRLAISFTGRTLHVKGTGPGVMSEAFLGKGSSGSVNDIGIRIVSLSSKKAVIRLVPQR